MPAAYNIDSQPAVHSLLIPMRYSLLAFYLAAAGASVSAQVAQIRLVPDDLAVNVDGKPFTIFHFGADANKPFLAPLRSVSGKIITRGFPMENIPGESRDHLHHRGLWFSYDDVNGVKFWENDPSYKKPNIGRILVKHAEVKEGKGSTKVIANMDWRDGSNKLLLTEDREMVFSVGPDSHTIDFHITLTAPEEVTIGDTKEGAFAIRLSDAFTERKGLKIVDADGRTRMVNVWGKRSNWVDYSADVEGEKIGVAMFDHPQNPGHPTRWHARDYGLFALNPFGQNAFDPKAEVRQLKLPRDGKLVYRWRVVIHPGDAETAHIADLYKEYAATP
jgi:hypothetical protein